ncbi:MAG: hypothetical protein JST00_34135 [Deltaproteobacteria bacterium]|nr:hypothetical protein [Deltaproteobacteria bacterium]
MRTVAKLGLLGMILASASASIACSGPTPEGEAKTAAWSCRTSAVPMGDVTTCTTSAAMTSDAVYECTSDGSFQCPPIDTSGGTSSTDDGATTGEGATSGEGDFTATSGEGEVSGGPNDECTYAPDLDHCGGGASSGEGSPTGTEGTTGEGSVGGGRDSCGGKTCPPGQTKKDGGGGGASSGGASSSGGSSGASSSGAGSSGGGGKGKRWKCERSGGGTTTCTSEPACEPGTHPAPCGACVPDSEPPSCDCVPPTAGGCWVTGGGFVAAPSLVPAAPADGHDNFGGNAKPMKDGTVKGQWNHVDHGTGNHAHGSVSYLFCRKVDGAGPGQPGGKKGLTSNQVYFGGPARFRTGGTWSDGYWFDVVAIDRGEPGSSAASKKGGTPDSYHFTIRKESDPVAGVSGAIVYETKGGLEGGNLQIHPPNAGHPAVSSPLPAWVALED